MIFLILSFLLATVIIFFIFKSLEDNVVYFFSPTEIYNKSNISFNEKIRIGLNRLKGVCKISYINNYEKHNKIKELLNNYWKHIV